MANTDVEDISCIRIAIGIEVCAFVLADLRGSMTTTIDNSLSVFISFIWAACWHWTSNWHRLGYIIISSVSLLCARSPVLRSMAMFAVRRAAPTAHRTLTIAKRLLTLESSVHVYPVDWLALLQFPHFIHSSLPPFVDSPLGHVTWTRTSFQCTHGAVHRESSLNKKPPNQELVERNDNRQISCFFGGRSWLAMESKCTIRWVRPKWLRLLLLHVINYVVLFWQINIRSKWYYCLRSWTPCIVQKFVCGRVKVLVSELKMGFV